MKNSMKLLAGASLAALGTTAANAAGTTSGSNITNTVSVTYSVNGITQTPGTASDTFTVDRKVSLLVAQLGSGTTSVTPGQNAAFTTFTVTNTSNSPIDMALTFAQQTGGVAAHGGTDNFDVTAPALFVDTNGNNVYDAGVDTAVSYLDEIAADASRTVFLVANVPLGAPNAGVAGVTLTARAHNAGGAGALGTVAAATTGANTTGVDTVLADGTSGLAGDANYDGLYSARDDFTVSAAALTITKTSRVISDPVNNTTNPKMIPGAVVEYCIQVANAGGAAASNVVISDPLPTQTTYLSTFGIFNNGTVTGGACNADGTTAGGTFASGTVTGNAMSVPAGNTRTLYFRATIN